MRPFERFIQQQNGRVGHQRDTEFQRTLIAVRKQIGRVVAKLCEADVVDHGVCLVGNRRVVLHGQPARLDPKHTCLCGKAQVLEHRHSGKHLGDLETASDTLSRPLVGFDGCDVNAVHEDLTAGRRLTPRQDINKGRFASSVGPNDTMESARLEVQRDVVHCSQRPKPNTDRTTPHSHCGVWVARGHGFLPLTRPARIDTSTP